MQEPSAGAEAPPLQLRILGGFHAERGGERISDTAWQRPRARALVKLLAAQPGHRLPREQVLDLLWPDLGPEPAFAALRKALTYARRALEPGLAPRAPSSYLHVHDGLLLLDERAVQVDADRFEKAATAALAGVERHALEAALALYAGEVLPEDRYEDWVIERREYLAELYLQVLEALAEDLEREGAYGEAIGRLQEVLGHDPTREEAHRRLMRLYALSGSRHQALRQYQVSRRVLMEELGVEPERETRELYQSLLERASSSVPGTETGGGKVSPATLPAAVVHRLAAAPLVGRERALEVAVGELGSPAGDPASPRS